VVGQDRRVLARLAARDAPPWVDQLLRGITHGGGAPVIIGLCLLLLSIPGTRHVGVVASLANLISHLAVQILKRTVVRHRPSEHIPHLTALTGLPDRFSFPSGHSCAAVAVTLPIALAAPLAGIPLLAVALLVGASRVYLRVHYVTDVAAGQLLGAASALLAWSAAW
jgi:undecaprenyl-diphosphatase